MTNQMLISMALAVFGVVLYQLAQKVQPAAVNPMVLLAIAYLVAGVICLATLSWLPGKIPPLQSVVLPAAFLGVAAVVVELGFMAVYRVGWDLSLVTVVANGAGALILIPIGVLLFKESISLTNAIGLLLCLVGLFLASKGS